MVLEKVTKRAIQDPMANVKTTFQEFKSAGVIPALIGAGTRFGTNNRSFASGIVSGGITRR